MTTTTSRSSTSRFAPTTRTADDDPCAPPGAAAGIELAGRNPRSVKTAEGWAAVIIGLPFVAAGVAVGMLVAGKIDIEEGGRLVFPAFAALTMGLCFAIAGLSFVAHGVRGLLRRGGAAARRARYPGQPWMADHAWERLGGRDEAPRDAWRALWFAAFLALFLVPFHWIAFFSADRPLILQVVTLIFDLVAVVLVGQAARVGLRRLRYGPSRLAFARFPVRPGTEAELLLDLLSPRARSRPLRATLRCVEERYEPLMDARQREMRTVCYELYRDEVMIPPGERCARFVLPEDAPTTVLSGLPPRYWELELRAEGAGADYGARFLVPVY